MSQRGICKVCGTSQKLRVNGKVGGHIKDGYGCEGEGKAPKRSRKKKEKAVTKKSGKSKKRKQTTKSNSSSKKKKKTKTHVAVCLDASSSMIGLVPGACNTFNRLCEPIREQGDDYTVSYYTFSTYVTNHFQKQSPNKLPKLTYYLAEGMTALNDSIHRAITDLEQNSAKNDSFLVIVITDGVENASKIRSTELAKLIKEKQTTDYWTFAISCPSGYGARLQSMLDIPAGNIQEWNQTNEGINILRDQTHSAVGSYTQSRASGQTAVRNFYVNIGRKSKSKIQKKLDPMPEDRFKKLKTSKSCQIREFIESKRLPFKKGCAYYALQKPEIVQAYKNIVLERRDNKKLFGGPGVRDILGIPANANGQVKPGNLGEWIVWVQSTSVNRKLLAKMELLFDNSAV